MNYCKMQDIMQKWGSCNTSAYAVLHYSIESWWAIFGIRIIYSYKTN